MLHVSCWPFHQLKKFATNLCLWVITLMDLLSSTTLISSRRNTTYVLNMKLRKIIIRNLLSKINKMARPMYQSKIHFRNRLMQPIFDRLGSEEFLVGCERCLDQNQNECLHHVIWGMAPKEQYTSQQETSLAVALGVLVFNNGIKDTISKLLLAMDLPVNPSAKGTGDDWYKAN